MALLRGIHILAHGSKTEARKIVPDIKQHQRLLLEARIEQEVETMLTEGDRVYLRELSCSDLQEVVETELGFLGLYSHEDQQTPVVIHEILEEHLDTWRSTY